MKSVYIFLLTLCVIFTATSCSKPNEKILINSPAYMYSGMVSKPLDVIIDGYFDKKEHLFKGSISFGGKTKLENVLFFSGTGLISYKGKDRTNLGQILFDEENHNYSMQISDSQFIELLTNQKNNEKEMLIISSPAENAEEAKEIYEMLIKSKQWFEE